MDRLADTGQFILQPLYILSGGAAAEEAGDGMAEMSTVYDETGRELYVGAGDREHD